MLKPKSLGKPGLNRGRAVFGLPLFQRLVIAAVGLDDFVGVRILIGRHLARLTVAALVSTAEARRRPTSGFS